MAPEGTDPKPQIRALLRNVVHPDIGSCTALRVLPRDRAPWLFGVLALRAVRVIADPGRAGVGYVTPGLRSLLLSVLRWLAGRAPQIEIGRTLGTSFAWEWSDDVLPELSSAPPVWRRARSDASAVIDWINELVGDGTPAGRYTFIHDDAFPGAFGGVYDRPPAPLRTAGPCAVLGLAEGCDEGEARAAYRRLALECHPDRGGDAGRMATVNAAWDELRRERGWRI